MKVRTRWYSPRLEQDVAIARWGTVGVPVLLFPTAGGDAEEVERFLMIDALSSLLEEERIKVYSCDSVAGRTIFAQEGTPRYQMHIQNQFHAYIAHEVVPAIHSDCQTDALEVITAGSSIGAFNALAVLCRYPQMFSHAICMSATFNLEKFIPSGMSRDFFMSSPLHFLESLPEDHLAAIRHRFVLLASGEGSEEDIGECWRMANLLGKLGIPNRVDSWGREWHHDWVTWRRMLPQYLNEFARRDGR